MAPFTRFWTPGPSWQMAMYTHQSQSLGCDLSPPDHTERKGGGLLSHISLLKHWISGELFANKALPCNLPCTLMKISWHCTGSSPNCLEIAKTLSDSNFWRNIITSPYSYLQKLPWPPSQNGIQLVFNVGFWITLTSKLSRRGEHVQDRHFVAIP